MRAAAVALLVACEGGGGGDPLEPTPASPDLVFTDANTYDFTATLELETTELAAGENIVIDWSGTSIDFRGRPFDPLDVDKVTIAAMDLDHDALIEAINLNSLQMESILTYYEVSPVAQTSVAFDAFTVIGVNTFPYAEDFVPGFAPSWLMSLWKENAQGVLEILSSSFVEPVPDAAGTLRWTDDLARLDFDPDLGAEPIRTVSGADAWSLDWSAVTVDVNGAPYDPLRGGTLRISHLPVADVESAEDALLQLDLVATEMYFADVFGLRAIEDLSAAQTNDGTSFSGFTTDGVWLVSIECTQLACFSPAPLLLAVVEVQ